MVVVLAATGVGRIVVGAGGATIFLSLDGCFFAAGNGVVAFFSFFLISSWCLLWVSWASLRFSVMMDSPILSMTVWLMHATILPCFNLKIRSMAAVTMLCSWVICLASVVNCSRI